MSIVHNRRIVRLEGINYRVNTQVTVSIVHDRRIVRLEGIKKLSQHSR